MTSHNPTVTSSVSGAPKPARGRFGRWLRSNAKRPMLHIVAGGAAVALALGGMVASAVTSGATTPQKENTPYLSVYPIAGTATGGEVTVRVKAWGYSNWNELSGAKVQVKIGDFCTTVTTDYKGEAEVRIPRTSNLPVTATLVDSPDNSHDRFGPIQDANNFASFGKPQADVIFVVDESGSTYPYHQPIQDRVSDIATKLAQEIDPQLGLVGFGALQKFNEAPYTVIPATDSLSDFSRALTTLDSIGGREWGTDAIVHALQSKNGIRKEAAACLVLIGDERTQTNTASVQDAANALAANDATLFSVVNPTHWDVKAYQDLATNSGGAHFDLMQFLKDPKPVLDAVLAGCVASVVERPDLSITVTDGQAESPIGTPGTHTVTVTNGGQAPAELVETTVEVQGPVTVNAVSGGGTATPGSAGGTQITWPTTTLDPCDSITYTVDWTTTSDAKPGDVVTVTGTTTYDPSAPPDLSPANNTATDTTILTEGSAAAGDQVVDISYVDNDNGNSPVEPSAGATTQLTGNAGDPVGFTEADALNGVPEGYELVSIDNVDTFDNDPNTTQVITVNLGHSQSSAAISVDRTIVYVGLPDDLRPADVVQTVVWQADHDNVTGGTTYSNTDGYPEVISPAVDGYEPSIAVVPAIPPVTGSTTEPVDETVVVTYLEASKGMDPPTPPEDPAIPPAGGGAGAGDPGDGSGAGDDGTGDTLPFTGPQGLMILGGAGVLAIGSGLALRWASRRRVTS
ncbi:MAG: VWA domain-containing protein [Bifidobacteriaceae bacterium]|jgi:Mg-chelatase subunit ChlD|nr:VWA domain-containing protein [Bifidobacteriaceae bacterium]